MKFICLLIGAGVFLPFSCFLGKAQNTFRVMSYNVENLFDTENNPLRWKSFLDKRTLLPEVTACVSGDSSGWRMECNSFSWFM